MTSPFRAVAAVAAGALGLTGLSVLAVASPARAADPAGALGSVVINEVSSNGYAGGDFIELYNSGTAPVDLTGYHLKDSKTLAEDDIALTGKIAPQGYAVVYTDVATALPHGFGLGAADEANLIAPDGTTVIDSYVWTAHRAPSWGRSPDGSGAFAVSSAATPGGPNTLTTAEAAVTLNEYYSDGAGTTTAGLHDYVEIYNGGSAPIDLSGWYVTDGAGAPTAADKVTLGGASATIPAGGYLAAETELTDAEIPAGFSYLPASNGTKSGFGLNKTDWVFLSKPDGTLVSTTFKGLLPDEHANTFSRLAPGTGLWKNGATQTPGAVNAFPGGDGGGGSEEPTLDPNWNDIEINEVSSLNAGQFGAPFADAVELYNAGASPVDINGWYQVDSGAAADAVKLALADLKVWDPTANAGAGALVAATSTVIPSHGYVAFSSKKGLSGEGDAVKVYGPGSDPATRQLVDTVTYTDGQAGISGTNDQGSASFAATTPGGDTFQKVTFQTLAQDNAAALAAGVPVAQKVKINELSAAAGKVELKNLGATPVDLSGWTFKTAAGTAFTVPASTTVAAGGLYTASPVTLTTSGTVTVLNTVGASSDTFTWTEDGNASYSRCEFGTATAMVETPQATFGAENACPQVGTETWPGPSSVTTVDDGATIGDADGNGDGDASGAVFDPTDPSILWVVQNKNTLHKLTKVNGTYVDVAGWAEGKKLHFASGTGAVDSEGLTIAPDGSIYVTSERDNSNNGISSNKIERYDVSAVTAGTTDLTATHEWDVNSFITTGVNLGLEGITYVPDSFLVDAGWKVDGTAYTAAAYPTAGLYVTAVEQTGDLHFFSLAAGSAPVEVKVEKSGFPFAMDVTFDAERSALWALCDDSCGGVYNVLQVSNGDFAVAHSLARPAGMANLNNEGMAIKPRSTAVDHLVEVVWTDDADTGGYSIREGHLYAAFPALAADGAPAISGGGAVGSPLTAAAGTLAFTPAATTTTYQWFVGTTPIGAGPVALAQLGSYTPTAADLGKAVTVKATGSLAHYDASTVTSTATTVVRGTLAVTGSLAAGTKAKVGVALAPTSSLAVTPTAMITYQWVLGGTPLATPTATPSPYTPVTADAGKQILVRAVATVAGYEDKVVDSAPLTIAAADVVKPPVVTPPTKAEQAVIKAAAKVKQTTAKVTSLKAQIKAAKKAKKSAKVKALTKKLSTAKKQLKKQKAALAKAKKAARK